MTEVPTQKPHSVWQVLARLARRKWFALLPSPVGLGPAELARIVVGITLGLLITGWFARAVGTGVWALGGWQPPTGTLAALSGLAQLGVFDAWGSWGNSGVMAAHLPWMVASMGATAMLVFATPASPMAQPWPVLAGTMLAAGIGTLAQRHVADAALACAIAVAATVALMAALRCMHPPAAGLAALIVLEGVDGLALLFFPIGLNVLVLLVCAWAYHAATGLRYPTWARASKPAAANAAAATATPRNADVAARTPSVNDADLDAALQQYGQVLDIAREDLSALIALATQASHARRWSALRCSALMREPAAAVEPDVPLVRALAHMRAHGVAALPVVDAERRVLGVLSSDAILTHWAAALEPTTQTAANTREMASTAAPRADAAATWGQRLRHIVRRGTGMVGGVTQIVVGAVQSLGQGTNRANNPKSAAAEPPAVQALMPVAQCMDANAPKLAADAPLSSVLPMLGQFVMWPVVDEHNHLLGIIRARDVSAYLAEPALVYQHSVSQG